MLARVRLAEPPTGKGLALEHPDARVAGRDAARDVGGAVGRTGVEDEDLQVRHADLVEHRRQARPDAVRLVPGREEHADPLVDRCGVGDGRPQRAQIDEGMRGCRDRARAADPREHPPQPAHGVLRAVRSRSRYGTTTSAIATPPSTPTCGRPKNATLASRDPSQVQVSSAAGSTSAAGAGEAGSSASSSAVISAPTSNQPAVLVSGTSGTPGSEGSGYVHDQWPAATICGSR